MPTFIHDFWPKRVVLPPQRTRTQVRAFSAGKVLQPKAEITNRIYAPERNRANKKERTSATRPEA